MFLLILIEIRHNYYYFRSNLIKENRIIWKYYCHLLICFLLDNLLLYLFLIFFRLISLDYLFPKKIHLIIFH